MPLFSERSDKTREVNISISHLSHLARNSYLLGRRRYWGDSVSELLGFGLEALDL